MERHVRLLLVVSQVQRRGRKICSRHYQIFVEWMNGFSTISVSAFWAVAQSHALVWGRYALVDVTQPLSGTGDREVDLYQADLNIGELWVSGNVSASYLTRSLVKNSRSNEGANVCCYNYCSEHWFLSFSARMRLKLHLNCYAYLQVIDRESWIFTWKAFLYKNRIPFFGDSPPSSLMTSLFKHTEASISTQDCFFLWSHVHEAFFRASEVRDPCVDVTASHPRVLQLILLMVMAPDLSIRNTRAISAGSGGGSCVVLLTTDSSPNSS